MADLEDQTSLSEPPGSYDDIRHLYYVLIEVRIRQPGHPRHYVSADELARAIEVNPGRPIPPVIAAYKQQLEAGKVKKPLGRKPKDGVEQMVEMVIVRDYRRTRRRLQQRKRTVGLNGWSTIKRADWWQGPPNERAAAMTAHRWRQYNISARYIQNLSSKYDYPFLNGPS